MTVNPQPPPARPSSDSISTPRWAKVIQHGDFLLLVTLFTFFRFCSVLFLRPGGYTRDYSDLIFYQSRASWQDFGLLPYRDYWSEYPPLFAWFTLWLDRLAQRIPLWEDERLWFAALFGIGMVLAETITLVCLYALARRLYGDGALRVAWIYAGLFVPVYFLSGWYDALPVATILLGLWALIRWPTLRGALIAGLSLGIGGALKLVPLAILAALPLAFARWRERIITALIAVGLVGATYGWAYTHGPTMTLTSIRSLLDRTGWGTLYAWINNYTRLGKVLGDVFDPTAPIAQYESIYPERLVLLGWLLLGAALLVMVWRRASAPQSARILVAFAAVTYAILLLSYTAWNPQYALYLLPFLALLWPNARGVLYALALMFLTLLEHPIYHNLIGPDYAPIHRQLIDIEYRQLFLAIIVARTVLLVAITVDLVGELLPRLARLRWLPLATGVAATLLIVALLPQFGRAYVAGRLATSSARPLIRYLNALPPSLTIVAQDLALGRTIRPLLAAPERLHLFGGRPGRLEPLPTLAAAGPFLYVRASGDDDDLATQLDANYACTTQLPLGNWALWFCNGATAPLIARFETGISLTAATHPAHARAPLQLTLFWQAEQAIAQDYTVFVHVVDASGTIIGQLDQQPAAGAAPTSSWLPGTLVTDEYQIPLRLRDTTAPYRILVGLYDGPTGTRLDVLETSHPVSDQRLEVATLEAE